LPEQLNGPGPDGQNQLVSLTQTGYIRRIGNDGLPLPPFDQDSAARERKVADPSDERLPIDKRARAYLHANCGHCHSEHGGGSVPLRLQFQLSDSELKAVNVPPLRGHFGLPEAAIIKPGDPHASTLYFRMAKFGRDRMPHIGSEQPDEFGLRLVELWIAGMQKDVNPPDVSIDGTIDELPLNDPKAALVLARKLGRGELKADEREKLLAAAGKLTAGPTRDLFEGYLPADEKGERKLGSNPRPKAILALRGDAAAGEKLFWSQAVNCGKCHKVGDRGAPVGPDLSAIGKQRAAEDLLESLLSPSRRIEPKYAAYLAHTNDGLSLSGLLIRRDESAVTLRDGEGKEVVLEAKEVEELRPLRTSLMPEGQMAGMTAQEAADLLAYLLSCKAEAAR
jgi:putative heme-binding domain-containing protein